MSGKLCNSVRSFFQNFIDDKLHIGGPQSRYALLKNIVCVRTLRCFPNVVSQLQCQSNTVGVRNCILQCFLHCDTATFMPM